MQANQILYPQGSKEITLAANESIAVQTVGKAQVFRKLGYPNFPDSLSLLGEVNNTETVYGPYTSGATIVIKGGAALTAYETGTAPVVLAQRQAQSQGAPVALNATGSITAAALLGGIVTSTTAAAVAGSVPTGAVLDAAAEGWQIGQSVDWTVIATGANAFTVTADTGHTLVGNMVVAAGSTGQFRTRKTAAATYITYGVAVPIS